MLNAERTPEPKHSVACGEPVLTDHTCTLTPERGGDEVTVSEIDDAGQFVIVYDGPALRDGRMSVGELAPALLAMAETFRETHEMINVGQPEVSLNFRATGTGSFEVHLELVQVAASAGVILTSTPVSAVVNLFELVAGPVGLFRFIKRLRNRTPVEVQPLPTGEVRMTFAEGDSITVPSELLGLERNVSLRRQLREVLAPLDHPGVDEFRVRARDTVTTVSIDREDLPAFEPPALPVASPGSTLLETDFEIVLTIITLSFDQSKKWRLSDGEQAYSVNILDNSFWARVHQREINFGDGDTLRCRMHARQSRDGNGKISTERWISKIIEFIPPHADGPEPLFKS